MIEQATELDTADPLRSFRNEFHIPLNAAGKPITYLCGHSLGLQPRGAKSIVDEVMNDWQRLGVEAHFAARHPWVSYHERATAGLAELTGALSTEVVAMNSLTTNLHLLLASFYRPTACRSKILIESNAFPSDRYAVASQIRWHGFDPTTALIEIGPRRGEELLRSEDICELLEREGPTIATVLLPGVQYLTGQRFNLAELTKVAHRKDCVIGFDLAHAIGNVPLALHDDDIDFAVWCSYKYLNAGPGAIGGAFVHERHARAFDLPRLVGWWAHDKNTRFEMPNQFVPLSGAEGWQVSNPSILSLAPLIASLEVFSRAQLPRLREKSLLLTGFLRAQMQMQLGNRITIITPEHSEARGCQLSLLFDMDAPHAQQLREELIARNIVCDWREPNVLRVAPTPLYNTYQDAATLVTALREILA